MPTQISAELRLLRDGSTHLVTPSGRQFTIAATPQRVWEQLLAHDNGERVAPEFVEVTSMLTDTGVFLNRTVRPATKPTFVVVGDSELCRRVKALYSASGSEDLLFGTSPELESLCTDDGQTTCVVGLYNRYDWRAMRRQEVTLRRLGIPYIFLHFEGRRSFFGPLVRCGDIITYQDVHERRLCATRDMNFFRIGMEAPVLGCIQFNTEELRWMVNTMWLRLGQWLRLPVSNVWLEVEVDPSTLQLRDHVVLPMPDKPINRSEFPRITPSDLCSARIGIVTKLEKVKFHTPAAEGLHAMQSWTADLRRVYDRDASPVNAGFSYTSEAEAEIISIAESVERYCGNIIDPSRIIWGSYEDFIATGRHAVDPERMALFSAVQYEARDFPFQAFERHGEVAWVDGISITLGEPALLPASLVYLNWYSGSNQVHAVINPMNFPGVSAGTSIEGALANALEEIVERDAMMAWWLTGTRLRRLPVPDDLAPRIAKIATHGYRCWFLRIDHPTGIPVVAAVLDSTVDEMTTVGFACRNTFDEASKKAWTEAVALHETGLDLQRPNGLIWGKTGLGRLGTLGLRPHREARDYAAAYRSDFGDVTSLFAQVQVSLDPIVRRRCLELLEPSGKALSDIRLDRDYKIYQKRIEESGFEIYMAEMTTPDIAAAGMIVLRAIVPGMLPNFPTAYRPLGGITWIREYARRVGWSVPPLTEDRVNLLPLPYA